MSDLLDREAEGRQAPTSVNASGALSRHVAGTAVRKAGGKLLLLLGGKVLLAIVLVLVLIVVLLVAIGGQEQQRAVDEQSRSAAATGPVDDTQFDAGNIISDAVFYDADAMTAQEIQAFLDERGAACTAATCLRLMRVTTPDRAATDLCGAYQGGVDELFSLVLWKTSQACGINPQVLLTTVQKESTGITRVNPPAGWDRALFGFACPDTGPGGTANCDPAKAGAAAQTWGLAQQFQRYTNSPEDWNYRIGSNEILYNVVERCQDRKTVDIVNQATANLYIYTPYTPSDASLAAYPDAVTGPAEACAAYGNRNFWFQFRDFFGSTGGGKALPAASGGPGAPSGALPAAPPFTGASAGCTEDDPTTGGCLTPATLHAHDVVIQLTAPRGISCWDEHAWNPSSDHPRGKACDIYYGAAGVFPTEPERARGWEVANWLTANQGPLNVSYVIWDGQIWNGSWRPYSSSVYDVNDPVGGHFDHIHLSITR